MMGKINGLWVKSFSTSEAHEDPEFLIVDGRPTKAPINADLTTKGDFEGLCNRSACLRPGANWWNVGSLAYYCKDCASMINLDGCRRFGHPDICFEGRNKESGISYE